MAAAESSSSQKESWSEDSLKEAMKKINTGEITINEVQRLYGIPPRVIYRQKAKENIKAQLNPDKPNRTEICANQTESIDYSILTQPVGISNSDLVGVLKIFSSGTEEVKNILKNECNIIYECKVCRALFRSIVNFITHKRLHCESYRTYCKEDSDNDHSSKNSENASVEEKLKMRQYIKEQINRPNRRTCRTDLTAIAQMMEVPPINTEPTLQLRPINTNSSALYQTLVPNIPFKPEQSSKTVIRNSNLNVKTKDPNSIHQKNVSKSDNLLVAQRSSSSTSTGAATITQTRFRCPCCNTCLALRKNVIRHLKTVHRKSVDQIFRLKSKIQIQMVNVKAEVQTEPQRSVKNEIASNSNLSLNIDSNNDEVRPVCRLCGKTFGYKRTLRVHLKQSCPKRKQLEEENTNEKENNINFEDDEKLSLIPVITLPLLSNAKQQSEKKIGIQVRMNYCKDSKGFYNNNGYADIRNAVKQEQGSVTSESSTSSSVKENLNIFNIENDNSSGNNGLVNMFKESEEWFNIERINDLLSSKSICNNSNLDRNKTDISKMAISDNTTNGLQGNNVELFKHEENNLLRNFRENKNKLFNGFGNKTVFYSDQKINDNHPQRGKIQGKVIKQNKVLTTARMQQVVSETNSSSSKKSAKLSRKVLAKKEIDKISKKTNQKSKLGDIIKKGEPLIKSGTKLKNKKLEHITLNRKNESLKSKIISRKVNLLKKDKTKTKCRPIEIISHSTLVRKTPEMLNKLIVSPHKGNNGNNTGKIMALQNGLIASPVNLNVINDNKQSSDVMNKNDILTMKVMEPVCDLK